MWKIARSVARLAVYWLAIGMVLWIMAVFIAISTAKGSAWIYDKGTFKLARLPVEDYFGPFLISFMGAPTVVGMLGYLLITSKGALPIHRISWIFKPIHFVTRQLGYGHGKANQWGISWIFKPIHFVTRKLGIGYGKTNQWGMGDHSFITVFLVFVAAPCTVYFWGGVYQYAIKDQSELEEPVPKGDPLYMTSIYFGLTGGIAMAFFLIPVARHNVLLVAVGWSPVHALKLHILSAYLAYGCITLHGLTYVIFMFKGYGADGHERIIDQIIPDAHCWVWKPSEELYGKCYAQWWNITGFMAFISLTVLVLTSLHWFRRKYYYAFYMCHIICGFLGIMFSIMHWDFLVVFMFPSLVYYAASTTPVLVQAVASRFRGGVQVTQVVAIKDAGGCIEVKVAATSSSSEALDNEACMVVKICVPSIAVNWHPFTVYKHADDPSTVRFLFRPIGPFTNALASRIVEHPRPVMILDGFYRGGDRVQEALCHDVVSIVCGGVALTPFLSMIPMLLRTMLDQPGVTQKLVLHWACREEGLISYITENYLKPFQHEASKLSYGFELQIVVYHTYHNPKAVTISSDRVEEVTDFNNKMDTTDQNYDGSDKTPSEGCSDDFKKVSPADGAVASSHGPVRGHAMEPARFMPGLYAKVWRNIPQFLCMSALLWGGIVIYTHYLNRGHTRIKILHWLAGTWSSVVWILSCIAFGVCVEATLMILRKFNLVDRPGSPTYAVTRYDAEEAHGQAAQSSQDTTKEVDVVVKPAIPIVDHRYGRPTESQIFGGLETSTHPAIFMCGPTGMTRMVRMAASSENSHFGHTRYALYEEPFEM